MHIHAPQVWACAAQDWTNYLKSSGNTHTHTHTIDVHRCTQTTPTTHEPLLKNASMYQSHVFCLTAGSKYAMFENFILHTQMTNALWVLNDSLIEQNRSRTPRIQNPNTVI